MSIDLNGNMNIPMSNSCALLGNTTDLGTGLASTTQMVYAVVQHQHLAYNVQLSGNGHNF